MNIVYSICEEFSNDVTRSVRVYDSDHTNPGNFVDVYTVKELTRPLFKELFERLRQIGCCCSKVTGVGKDITAIFEQSQFHKNFNTDEDDPADRWK
mgnify:FL=1|jgi:hypothetical protein